MNRFLWLSQWMSQKLVRLVSQLVKLLMIVS